MELLDRLDTKEETAQKRSLWAYMIQQEKIQIAALLNCLQEKLLDLFHTDLNAYKDLTKDIQHITESKQTVTQIVDLVNLLRNRKAETLDDASIEACFSDDCLDGLNDLYIRRAQDFRDRQLLTVDMLKQV